ncbi:MAG: type IV pilus twitching motility protein PilT [Myxococcota bacterium]|nr:type IV pilus twitching motility protein PilT [Myxococcota bacterium]
MTLEALLRAAVTHGASDLHLRAGRPPMLRIEGQLRALGSNKLSPEDTLAFAAEVTTEAQLARFEELLELDVAYGISGLARFRVNLFHQRSSVALVLRAIATTVPSREELHLPPILDTIAGMERGLVLVTGTTGSGKSTTLAALVDSINGQRSGHILTIEDPIEYLHRDRKCIVSQREVGTDTPGYASALRAGLRQDPDVILVGEMRDLETVEIALNAAETGHLVLSTVHSVNATETISRIVSLFPPHHQEHIRLQLASTLQAILSQRLVPRIDGEGRIPAVEILLNHERVRDLILDKNRTAEIPDALAAGAANYGTQTFDQSLYDSYKAKLIAYDEALRNASKPDDFALRVRGVVSADATF